MTKRVTDEIRDAVAGGYGFVLSDKKARALLTEIDGRTVEPSLTNLDLANDFEILMGALADIGRADDMTLSVAQRKANRVYREMRAKYPIDAREHAEPPANPAGCSIHGPCPVCKAIAVLGDPRVGVQLAGPNAGATFNVGAVLYNPAPYAAAAAQPGVFAWVCTKHGNIPYQDCMQCAHERDFPENRPAEPK